MWRPTQHKHPNVKINIEMVPNDNFLTMLKTKIASNDAPMIFDLDRINTLEFAKAGNLADVSATEGLKENFSADILSQGKIGSTLYGVPLDVSAYGIFYNKDVFDKYGLQIPTTDSELKKVCETLLANGITPFGASLCRVLVSEALLLRVYLHKLRREKSKLVHGQDVIEELFL
ncbi:ABC transporter substrate-binding protein [uncultured Sphaerochaeta sp.]|uniref:ABC transporter substrate-binding protein n=1 Tax=uncultured Sphaerochaeta sp. TaxID=886478 RepID=UPI002A0A120F|nr:ABC transporter substrate-binding protein [uncultured Sphaerochaeta sp.]